MGNREQDTERMIKLSHFTIERAATPIFWVDSSGRIVRANEAACRSLNYTREDLVGMKVPDIDADHPAERWPEIWARQEKNKSHFVFDSHHRTREGKLFPVEITANYIEFRGVQYSCVFVTDITGRIQTEERLKNALKEVGKLKSQLQAENSYLQDEIKIAYGLEGIAGHSEAFKAVIKQVEQVAPTNATVLVLGETGTGKELLARGVHNLSARKDRPLVKVNCAALPASLIESELFGHEKGAFTGALARKVGRFELADRGTIFLDEIGDLPLELQAKLLRVLQEGEFERLGDPKTIRVDVRVIAATNRNLEKAVGDGDFREDLFYRLNVFPIRCPPLRERKEDIPALVSHFVDKFSLELDKKIDVIPAGVVDALQDYSWPGNVRELANMIERAAIITRGNVLELGDWLEGRIPSPAVETSMSLKDVERHQKELEREHVVRALESTGWRVSGPNGAAKVLGLKPTTLEARMKRLGIKRRG